MILQLHEMKKTKTKEDEKALLQSFTSNITAYEKLVKEALADNKVTPDEMVEIQIIEKKILMWVNNQKQHIKFSIMNNNCAFQRQM